LPLIRRKKKGVLISALGVPFSFVSSLLSNTETNTDKRAIPVFFCEPQFT
jgi:hypothetical protein